jgi:hypothetical protein
MFVNYENNLCYFCDETFPKHVLLSIKGIKEGICCHCENKLPIKYNNVEIFDNRYEIKQTFS